MHRPSGGPTTPSESDELARLRSENIALQKQLAEAQAELHELCTGFERQLAAHAAEFRAVSERLVRATRAAHVGIWDWDVAHNRLHWDDNMYELYGLERGAFAGAFEAWQAAVHPEDLALATRAVKLALEGKEPFDTQFRIVTSGGEMRYIRGVASVERDGDGTPRRMLGVNWNVTREALARRELAINEERWNFALQGTGDGVWDWDLLTGDVFLSQRSREMLGYPLDGVVSRETLLGSVHPDDIEVARAAMDAHLRGESPAFSCEYRVRRPDGHFDWIHGRGRVMVRDAQGRPLRVVGTYKDVSERRRAQQALEHREALLREFIAHTPAAIAVLDRELRYVQASQRWLKDYKLIGQQIIGKSHYEVFPEIPQQWREIHARVLTGAVESREEDAFPRENGEVEWLQWEARPWHEVDGTIGGVIFFTQVITARKQLELALEERNHQLSRSNTELEQFAYAASHDLQEPLRAVAGCAQLIARRHHGKLDRDTDVLIEHVVDGASRMGQLIDGLLTLSRVSGAREVRSETDSSVVASRAIQNLDAPIKATGAQVSVGPLPKVTANPLQLLQLLQNLIGNALKYRSGATPQVRVSAKELPGAVQFSVQDNGIGIPREHFSRIFGVFQRLHTRDEYPGTGIGLAICRKIVESHGGEIWLESTPGEGSTFHFLLPRRSQAATIDLTGDELSGDSEARS